MQEISAQLTLKDQKIAIVAGRFNEFITSKLVGGAVDCLKRHGLDENHITLAWVPGAFEIPYAAQKLAASKKFDAIICLGCVIRGATPHFDYVCSQAAKGIMDTGLKYDLPVSFGVLTTDSIEQALERAGTKAGNKGWEAAVCAIEMVNLNHLF